MFVGVPPDLGAEPTSLNAMAYIRYLSTGFQTEFRQLLWLPRDPGGGLYTARTGPTGYNLVVDVTYLPHVSNWELQLLLAWDATPLTQATWFHFQPPDEPRWDTGLLTHAWPGGYNEASLRIMG